MRLAAYKVSTHQIHTPISELSPLQIDTFDSVSQAIRRFRESEIRQERADYYRKHNLATICRREARRTRTTLTRKAPSKRLHTHPAAKRLIRHPPTIIEVPSDREEQGLPTPPDSQSKPESTEAPSTPLPKPKIRRVKPMKKYNEQDGHLGWSSPPREHGLKANREDWCMQDVEVGDVPSSVLRGVEGLWALGCSQK